MKQRRSLDVLVTDVATRLIGVDASTVQAAYTDVLRDLVGYFEVDASYLRHNDHEIRATVMVAEWPVRVDAPDPDPLGVVYFDDADPVFAQCENMKEPTLFRPDPEMEEYRRKVREGRGYLTTSMAAVPLVTRRATTGLLGFIKIGDRSWSEDEINALKAIASLFTQLQARIVAEESLRVAAMHDALTGLYNRRGMMDHFADRPREPVAALFLDLDRLKALNDFLGHGAGDDYLRTVAGRLRSQLSPDCVVGRWGGDEFVVVVPGVSTESVAMDLAEQVQRAVIARVPMADEFITRTASLGLALGFSDEPVDTVIGRADQAALAAKKAGGNAIFGFDADIERQNELHNDIELHLRSAIECDSLFLCYQPEVDLATGRITAVEALVRWQHPTRGMLPPTDFIAIAEASNMATDLGRWVLADACRTFARWHRSIPGLDITLRVNVSPAQLLSADFVDDLNKTLAAHDVVPETVCVEITEVAVVHDLTLAAETLRAVRSLGVRVAIDDFGTGYSSLSHLKVLPVDAVKIDREFVEHLGSDNDDRAIVKAITTLAGAYGLGLIAEGVETVAARDTLLTLGCTRAQGYLYSRPVPADDMEQLLHRGAIDPAESAPGDS